MAEVKLDCSDLYSRQKFAMRTGTSIFQMEATGKYGEDSKLIYDLADQAETSEDLYEWKTALETAVAQAPSVSASGNDIFNNEQDEAANEPVEPHIDKLPTKSMVVGRPVLLALEDIDGSPSFLEKALRFIEQHGVTVEGILRQAADVDDVYRRVHEYEKGSSTEFNVFLYSCEEVLFLSKV